LAKGADEAGRGGPPTVWPLDEEHEIARQLLVAEEIPVEVAEQAADGTVALLGHEDALRLGVPDHRQDELAHLFAVEGEEGVGSLLVHLSAEIQDVLDILVSPRSYDHLRAPR
jgi:hypothetical protein